MARAEGTGSHSSSQHLPCGPPLHPPQHYNQHTMPHHPQQQHLQEQEQQQQRHVEQRHAQQPQPQQVAHRHHTQCTDQHAGSPGACCPHQPPRDPHLRVQRDGNTVQEAAGPPWLYVSPAGARRAVVTLRVTLSMQAHEPTLLAEQIIKNIPHNVQTRWENKY